MNVKSVQPKTIHVVGDSHALAFKRKSIELSDLGMIFSTSVSYVRGIQPSSLAPEGQVHSELAKYFIEGGLITPDGKPLALTDNSAVIAEQYATGAGFQREIVVFHIGEIYVRKYLGSVFKGFGAGLDDIETLFRAQVELYVRTVAGISRSFGFFAVIHELSPPTDNDDLFEKINGFRCSREHRGGAYRLFNTLLHQYEDQYQVLVCPAMDYLSNDRGCLNSEYEFDGVHADPKYTAASLKRIARAWLYNRSAERSFRYSKWVGHTLTNACTPEISRIGLTGPVQAFDELQVATLRGSIGQWQYQACERPSIDWAHVPPNTDYRKFNPAIQYGNVDAAGLKVIFDVIIKGPVGDSVRSAIGSKFSVINVRGVKSIAHAEEGVGQQAYHRDLCPEGIFRGLVYLVDVGENDGGFEFMPADGSPDPIQIHGDSGSWIFFDANAIEHRASPPRAKTRIALDLILLAIPEQAKEFVLSPEFGLVWPIDPYMFSLSGDCYPTSKSRRAFTPALIVNKASGVKTL